MKINISLKSIYLSLIISSVLIAAGCDSSSSTDTEEPAGDSTINTSGGLGGAGSGYGGSAGSIISQKYGNGDIMILNSGTADASFTAVTIEADAGNTGDNPLNVTADMTIQALSTGDGRPALGSPYFIDNGDNVYISNGSDTIDGTLDPVTGIEISEGAILTVGLNETTEGDINVINDIINHGSITTADVDAGNRGHLILNASTYWGTGSVSTAGTEEGQNGGNIEIQSVRSIINQGDMDSGGADGVAGDAGKGGSLDLDTADGRLENTGDLNSSGGSAVVGQGGGAGTIDLLSNYGGLRNSGNLTAMGGRGATGGGDGGAIYLSTGYTGIMLNDGDLNTSGGDTTGGDGGNASSIALESYSAPELTHNGDVTARGGLTTDPDGDGGRGNYLSIYNGYESLLIGAYEADGLTIGPITISGDIDLRGGDALATGGGSGGRGGYVEVGTSPSGSRGWKYRDISFLGYTDIFAQGGDGNYAGSGSDLELVNQPSGPSDDELDYVAGSIINEANFVGTGGNVPAGAIGPAPKAGGGGYVEFSTASYLGELNPDSQMVSNSGDIDLSAGTGSENLSTSERTNSGSLYFFGYNGVSNTGMITASAGDDDGSDGGIDGYGGSAGDIRMYTNAGTVSNTGDISANGGAGEYSGGDAGIFHLWGQEVSNTAAVTLNGGNADATLDDSEGGDGAFVDLFAPDGDLAVSNSGSITSTPGTGTTAGSDPQIIVGDTCTGFCQDI